MRSDSPDVAANESAPPVRREPWESPWVWGLVLLVGAAVLCRQYYGAISYWYDEGFYLFNVFRRPFSALIGAVDCRVAAPPLFLWTGRAVYLLLGPSELAMRLPSFLAGLAALGLLVPLARRAAAGPGWVWAPAFCALSAHFVMHACEMHPYAIDMFCCEAVLLAGCVYVAPDASRRSRAAAAAALFAAALLLPWLSFPSAFSLGAAGLALLTHALRRRSPGDGLVAALFGGLTVLSAAALWYFHARHLYYVGLQDEWSAGFPDWRRPWAAVVWFFNTPVEVGNYASQAMGVPIALLAAVGLWAVARRSPPVAVLTAGPIALGMTAACLRRYPMDNRLLMYAAPCLWLLAAAGVGAVIERARGRRKWAVAALCGLLLVNGGLETAKEIATVRSRGDWRGAFAYIHQHKAPGDVIWVAFPQVYEAYHGDPQDFMGEVNAQAMERAALRGRVWVASVARHEGTRQLVEELERQGCVRADSHGVDRVDVYLYAPPAAPVGDLLRESPAGRGAAGLPAPPAPRATELRPNDVSARPADGGRR